MTGYPTFMGSLYHQIKFLSKQLKWRREWFEDVLKSDHPVEVSDKEIYGGGYDTMEYHYIRVTVSTHKMGISVHGLLHYLLKVSHV
jgi:hypothetical protein